MTTQTQTDTVTIPRQVAETLCEALDILPNPYDLDDDDNELALWGDFDHARDILNVSTYPDGSVARAMREAGCAMPEEVQ